MGEIVQTRSLALRKKAGLSSVPVFLRQLKFYPKLSGVPTELRLWSLKSNCIEFEVIKGNK